MNGTPFFRVTVLAACVLTALAAPAYAQAPAASFGSGFHKEEKVGDAGFRWARQKATFTITGKAAGRHTIDLSLCSAFGKEPIRVELRQADGRVAGMFTVTASEPTRLQSCRAVVELASGPNELTLRTEAPEVRFSAEDQRDIAMGAGTSIRVSPESPAGR